MFKLPSIITKTGLRHWQTLQEVCQRETWFTNLSMAQQQNIQMIFSFSEYIARHCIRYPDILEQLLIHQQLQQTYNKQDFYNLLQAHQGIATEAEFMQVIRIIRQQMFVRIAWRDLAGIASLQETVTELSLFADTMIQFCYQWQHQHLAKLYGEPTQADGSKQEMVIIAVGKLGANELNFSSDIDLIFCYYEDTETSGPKKIAIQQFFYLLAQKLIKLLSQITEHGFVFRVDMRLRPFGSTGPLVISYAGLETYYQESGRAWERYALTRARLITGDPTSKINIQQIVRNFVYKPYLDFSVIESLRKMKLLIQRESQGLEQDIKRGDGGIREIEFIVQVFQLIRGGKETDLTKTSILELLPILSAKELLPQADCLTLMSAYEFYRMIEHHLQEYNDEQTQKLPTDSEQQLRLAISLQFSSWEILQERIIKYRKIVNTIFKNLIKQPKINVQIKEDPLQSQAGENSVKAVFQSIDWLDENHHQLFVNFWQNEAYQTLSDVYQIRLQNIVKGFLRLLAKESKRLMILPMLIDLWQQICIQANYIDLLMENSILWTTLITLYKGSAWLATQIQRYPFLLEELINKQLLYSPYSPARLDDELRQYLLAMPEEDQELQMEYLRRFKLIQTLKVAAADLKGNLSLMKVSDHLTFTAVSILNYVQSIVWHQLVRIHGRAHHNNRALVSADFCIIAYGKLGGIELNYDSDLDLVFLHPDIDPTEMTDGLKPITNSELYIRLAQKIIYLLNTVTKSGRLYAIDTRLRPSGNAGLLVNSIQAFSDYQKNKAWTWEQQALVRARPITGSAEAKLAFALIRKDQLCKSRDAQLLAEEVSTMRAKMRASLPKCAEDEFDVINGAGGIKDIEFLVQYLVLRFASKYPSIVDYTDNIRIIESLMLVNILDAEIADKLAESYRFLRNIVHHYSLQNKPAFVAINQIDTVSAFVQEQWRYWQLN